MDKVIHTLWLQGEDAAPDIVRMCMDRWRRLNPDYRFHVLTETDIPDLLSGTDLRAAGVPVQALSDIVRARLLLLHGGIWVDATVLPLKPLDDWLPDMMSTTGFFAFEKPEEDRPISSWFLAASRNHRILQRWWDEIVRFWSAPRTAADYGHSMIPPDPVKTVAPYAPEPLRVLSLTDLRRFAGRLVHGRARRIRHNSTYPYFWFHYLFRYLIERDPEIAEIWAQCAKVSAVPPHRLQALFVGNPSPSTEEILDACVAASVQKLNWRTEYPIDELEAVLQRISSTPSAAEPA